MDFDMETVNALLPAWVSVAIAAVVGAVWVYEKIQSMRQSKAQTVEAFTGAAENAATTLQLALAEVRTRLAEQEEKNALARKASLEKDIEHTQTIKAQGEEIGGLKTRLETTNNKLEEESAKRRKSDERVSELERRLKEEQDKRKALEAKVERLEQENEQLRTENTDLRARVTDVEALEKPAKDADEKKAAA